jgi:hypothetical protein
MTDAMASLMNSLASRRTNARHSDSDKTGI